MTNDGINASRHEVRKFGIMFAVLCALAAGFMLFKGDARWPWFTGGAVAFLAGGLFAYHVLRPVYIGWMKFAHLLAWINTRVLLGVFFYLVLTPVGLAARLLGKDLLDEKLDRSAPSYWKKRAATPMDRARYEHLF